MDAVHIYIWFRVLHWALPTGNPEAGIPGVCATWTGVTERGHDGRRGGLGALSNTDYPLLSLAEVQKRFMPFCIFSPQYSIIHESQHIGIT